MSKIKGRLDPPIPLVMRIVILFDWRMEYLLCFIGPKDSHLNFNWMAIHSQIFIGPWRMRRPLVGAKGFRSFHWTRGTRSRKVMEACQRGDFGCMWKKGKNEEEVWGRTFSSYVWRGAHGKCVWKNEAWNGVVGSKLSWWSLWTLVWLIVSLKSTIGFVSKLDQF